ncbi:FRG domain-containing protein [Klenkia marina]|nr:FRG domain-containing protein [Klenkia marina]
MSSAVPTGQADPQWVRGGWGHTVRSQDEALRAVMRIVGVAPGRQYVWRGCVSSRRPVRSSLLQSLVVEESEPLPDETLVRGQELALLRSARAWGPGAGPHPQASDLELLAHLQRHGVPTRLVEVTRNPLTALWFACARGDDESGVLVALDVTDLPVHPTVDPQPHAGHEGRGWALRRALRRSAVLGQPFLVQPTDPDRRTAAQEGLYLTGVVPRTEPVRGLDGLPLRPGTPPGKQKLADLFAEGRRRAGRPGRLPFCALVVPADLKRTIRTHLTAVGRQRAVLFPDVDGFRDAVRDDDVDLHPTPPVLSPFDDALADEPAP